MLAQLEKIDDFTKKLDEKTLLALRTISIEKSFKKGDFLLQQGEICRKSYWIETGIARKFYINDGKEITTEIYFQNDLAISFNSYCLQNPSTEFIQLLTDCTIIQTDFFAFQDAKIDFPKLVTLDLMMTEYYAMWLEKRLFQFHTMDATHRYLDILMEHSHIIQHIPLTIIASYLGISLETLSRIRAKI
jgi:CRP-like cAMP-binding protein